MSAPQITIDLDPDLTKVQSTSDSKSRTASPAPRARPCQEGAPTRKDTQAQRSFLHPEWENITKSPLPNKHWVVCWLEEVLPYQVFTEGKFNATAKSLVCSMLVRFLLLLASMLPGTPFRGWSLGPTHGNDWNIWGPQEGPSLAFLSFAFGLFLASVELADFMPVLGVVAEEKAAYTDFKSFWTKYVGEHRNPKDRVAHVFEFFGVLAFMIVNPGRLAAFSVTLGLGALLTRPLLHVAKPRVESDIMYVIGASLATFYGVPLSFALGYSVWLAFDYTGHAYLGENKAAAAFLGEHYLAWALVGQSWFSTRVLLNMPTEFPEFKEAMRCLESER